MAKLIITKPIPYCSQETLVSW